MAKLITAIACLQLVENGVLSLDGPVDAVLDEFKTCSIITGFDTASNTATTEAAPRCPTLRELLTHSSGCGYTAMDPLLTQWWASLGRTPDVVNNNITYSHSGPLLFAPGTAWMYGCGHDWAGQMVARASGLSLEEYLRRHVFEPLGMHSTTFHPTRHPEIMARMTSKPMRNAATGRLEPDVSGMYPIIDPEDDFGGAGLYSSAADYVRVLGSLLRDDGALLSPAMRSELFRPCLSRDAERRLHEVLQGPFWPFLAPGYCAAGDAAGGDGGGVRYNYAPGGNVIVNDAGLPGVADRGTLYWAGFPNSNWVRLILCFFLTTARTATWLT